MMQMTFKIKDTKIHHLRKRMIIQKWRRANLSKEEEYFQKRVYQLHEHGNSYCITIPKPLITEEMIKYGVHIYVLDYSKDDLIIKLVIADEHREHTKDSQESRSNPQKSRTTNNNL